MFYNLVASDWTPGTLEKFKSHGTKGDCGQQAVASIKIQVRFSASMHQFKDTIQLSWLDLAVFAAYGRRWQFAVCM